MRSTTGVSSATGSGFCELHALELGLEHLAQVLAVLARQLRRVELADEAVDHLTRQVELRLLDGALAHRLLDLGL